MENKVSVIIIDDHPIVLQGFTYMLQDIAYIHLTGSFTAAKSGIDFITNNQTDVVLLDINMPDMNGIEACEIIKKIKPDCKIIAISNNNDYSIVQRMLQSGASGYILKNASKEELITCIDEAMNGEIALSESVKEILRNNHDKDLPALTRREKEILRLLADGLTTPDIAKKIFVSPLTVETHRRNLLSKFNVPNAAALIRKAVELRYI